MITYLTKQDLIYINQQVLAQQGTQSQLFSETGLEGALMRPQTAAYYQNADIVTQGALLIAGIALAHAFLDGNKRTALVNGYDFFRINVFTIVSLPLELAQQIEMVVNRSQSLDIVMQDFTDWLRSHIH